MHLPKIVAFVPIRLNNERLPNKNLLDLGGKPLCWHLLEELTKSEYIRDIFVYCSDERITNFIPSKVKFVKRDSVLDGNQVKGNEIYRKFVQELDADLYVLAHVTSPFLKVESVDNAIKKILESDFDSALSVQKIQTYSWFKQKPINYDINDVARTQNLEPMFVETSGFFIFAKDMVLNNRRLGNKPHFQVVNAFEALDIDEKQDFEFAKVIFDYLKNDITR